MKNLEENNVKPKVKPKLKAKPKMKPKQNLATAVETQFEAETKAVTEEDYLKYEKKRIAELSAMSNYAIYSLIKQLEAQFYRLSRLEAQELVRGKYMHVLGSKKKHRK